MPKTLHQVFLAEPKFMGVITPSGNTVVERVTLAILENFPQVTPLFSRTPVFGETDAYPTSYDEPGMLGAARLLAHAKPDVMVWNGSKGAKIGVACDHDFSAKVLAETGIPCSTSIIAMEQVLRERKLTRVALVTPYDDVYQEKLIAALVEAGYDVVGESHAAQKDNISFASISAAEIGALVRKVAPSKPDAILVLCTNLPAAPVVPALEEEFDILTLDSTALGVWAGLKLLGLDTTPARAWGRLFG
ncbi:maleate cis-trans isomerase family protein [Variovorax sp. HJSM1_2]|uniref:maleate cis-trans isomerase family protein n=1 Tax=Variovorax sp. HJSM1_2 TaxID=3366263 RepID=UPI003BD628EE